MATNPMTMEAVRAFNDAYDAFTSFYHIKDTVGTKVLAKTLKVDTDEDFNKWELEVRSALASQMVEALQELITYKRSGV